MKNVWYFTGLLLTVLGAIITANGVYQWFVPPVHQPVLGELHAGVWWGAIMLLAGVVFVRVHRDEVVE